MDVAVRVIKKSASKKTHIRKQGVGSNECFLSSLPYLAREWGGGFTSQDDQIKEPLNL